MGLLRRCAKPKNVTFVQEQQQVMAGEKESRKFHFAEPLAANISDGVRSFSSYEIFIKFLPHIFTIIQKPFIRLGKDGFALVQNPFQAVNP